MIDKIGSSHVPDADSALNELMTQVIGNKTDTALQAYTAADSMMRYIKGLLELNALYASGRLQIVETTIDLNQAAANYTLFTGTTQDVIVEKLVISMPNIVAGGALTSISIQTNDATPQVFIDNVLGAVANLTAEAQLAWVGAISVKIGKLIQLTINGGAHGVAYVCDVEVQYRAVVAGGYLA